MRRSRNFRKNTIVQMDGSQLVMKITVTFLYDQGMFIRQAFDSLSDEVHKNVVYTVGDFILVIVEGIFY